jgi:hypothetical protein
VHLILLFSVGFLIIATTAIRLPLSYFSPNDQVSSTILISAEALAAAIVANVTALYALRSKGSSSLSRITSVTEMPRASAPPVSQRSTMNYPRPSPGVLRVQTAPLSREWPLPASFQGLAPGEPARPSPGLTRWQRQPTSSLPRSWRTPGTALPSEQVRLVGARNSINAVELGIPGRMHTSKPLPPPPRSTHGPGAGAGDRGERERDLGWPLWERGLSVQAQVAEQGSYFNHDDEEYRRVSSFLPPPCALLSRSQSAY